MENISATTLLIALRSLDMVPFGYSGRGMYGRQCVAVDTEDRSTFEVFADILEYSDLSDDLGSIAHALRNAKTDSLGRGQVLYFPKFTWDESCEEDDD